VIQDETITVEIAPGELIDKITILEIKSERMTDTAKLDNVRIELATLADARDAAVVASAELTNLTDQLKSINERLWDIEDDIRDCERVKDFGEKFIELARSVYKCNDKRAALKRDINTLLGSRLVEEKSYREYE
jgi:hypothetical protein